MKWPFSGFTLNPRNAKIVIRNADCRAMYHFHVNSDHIGRIMTIIIYSFPIQPHPVFKSAVIRLKTRMDWSILKPAEDTMDLVKNKYGLMNTQACRKTVHLLENTNEFKNTRSTLSKTGACKIYTLKRMWVLRASVTDRGSLVANVMGRN